MLLHELASDSWKALTHIEKQYLMEIYHIYEPEEVKELAELIVSPKSATELVEKCARELVAVQVPADQAVNPLTRDAWEYLEDFVSRNRGVLENMGATVLASGFVPYDRPQDMDFTVTLVTEDLRESPWDQIDKWESEVENYWDPKGAVILDFQWLEARKLLRILTTENVDRMKVYYEDIDMLFTTSHGVLTDPPVYTPGSRFGAPDLTLVNRGREQYKALCARSRVTWASLGAGIQETHRSVFAARDLSF